MSVIVLCVRVHVVGVCVFEALNRGFEKHYLTQQVVTSHAFVFIINIRHTENTNVYNGLV